jgi:hypothetical protein
MFGSRPDVPNPLMSGVAREHFEDGRICAGCHEQEQPVLVPGAAASTERWPSGRLPVPDEPTWRFTSAEPTADPGSTDVVYTFSGDVHTDEWLINGEKFPNVTVAGLPPWSRGRHRSP